MLFRIIFSVFTLLTLHSFSNPTQTQLNQFFQTMVQEARNTLPGLKPQAEGSNDTALQQFTDQNFLLWDYLTNVADSDLPQHFDDLLALCQRRKIRRVIIFIKDPNFTAFFQPTNTSANSFVTKANNLFNTMSSVVSGFDLSVFFESDNFTSNAASGTAPAINPEPDTQLANYFPDIKNMLDWCKAMIALVPGIKEIAFDPEVAGANKSIQQLLYNYTDEYKWLNSLGAIRIGTTLGVDESKSTLGNLSTFPVNTIYSAGNTNFPPNPQPAWARGSDPTLPLLQSVYIQVYQPSIPAMFASGFNQTSGKHSGGGAALIFNQLLRDQPYVQGKGLITFSKGNTTVKGSKGTVFKSFADPILYANDTVNNIPNRKIAVVSTIQSDTQLTVDSLGATFTETNSPFTRTEIATGWNTQPNLTQSMVNNIYWMYSVNYDPSKSLNFFGNWQLIDFMEFILNIPTYNNASKTNPFPGFTFPSKNFVIYQYDFATTIVNTTPMSNGVAAPWSL